MCFVLLILSYVTATIISISILLLCKKGDKKKADEEDVNVDGLEEGFEGNDEDGEGDQEPGGDDNKTVANFKTQMNDPTAPPGTTKGNITSKAASKTRQTMKTNKTQSAYSKVQTKQSDEEATAKKADPYADEYQTMANIKSNVLDEKDKKKKKDSSNPKKDKENHKDKDKHKKNKKDKEESKPKPKKKKKK